MRKLFLYATITSAAVAAYLLYKRGVPVSQIATNIIQHPIGTLVNELQNASRA